ncbi:tetratricopeptide repeat protein, partial [Prochlorococcus marinus]
NPNSAEAHSNLGNILRDLGKLQEAELLTRRAIDLNPNSADAYSNLGVTLIELGKLQEAELLTRRAIELNPDYADAYSNLSYLELLNGDYKFGLENYEFRFKTKQPAITHSKTKIKKVDHQSLDKPEKLLVISEQGLGDTLQFMRYIPYLRKQGLDISFSAQEKLHSLIKASGIDPEPLTPEQASNILEGEWIPLLSLLRYLKVRPENPIITEPYIYSTTELNQKWKDILSKEKRPIIGINWQGNPNMEKLSYQGRSIPLVDFSILAIRNEVTMLSLQKGFGSEQLEHCSFKNKFVECQPQIDSTWDFLENAAIIENCDLIITCDTSIAHLAGGMGKKVWLLLKDIPYWTWGLKGENTFWYSSMKLFRQKERHNWQEVMERVSMALSSFEDVEHNLI